MYSLTRAILFAPIQLARYFDVDLSLSIIFYSLTTFIASFFIIRSASVALSLRSKTILVLMTWFLLSFFSVALFSVSIT